MELTTRVDRLDATMAELASALTRLTDAQTRTEERVEQLADAQLH